MFGVTGYVWGQLGGANGGLTTADVLDSGIDAGSTLDGSMDILLVGMDARTDAQGNPLDPKVRKALHAGSDKGELNTDTMMLVHIPDDGKHATAISLPRDSLVERPGYGKGKLNSAFLAARNSKLSELKQSGDTDKAEMSRQSKAAGARELIKTVEHLTDVKIEHYAAVNLVGFYNISKAVGGVPVCLKHDISDPYYTGAHFHKGVQSIKGKQALAFVRQRHNIPGGSTDLQRERRQQAFLASMAHKVLSAGTLTNPSRLSGLVGAVQKSLTVDPHWDLLKFARQMQGLTSGNITFTTMPVVNIEAQSGNFGSYVKVDPEQVEAFIKNRTNPDSGSAGDKGSDTKPTAPSPQADNNADNSATTVDIRNAAGITGMAGRVRDTLKQQGFSPGGTGNASARQSTVVHYASGSKSAAQQVSEALGGGLTLQRDTSLPGGTVRVYLGTNYSGPGRQAGSGGAASSAGGGSGTNGTSTPSDNPPKPPKPPIVESGDGPPCVN